jgi:hypothetical protein
MLCNRIKFKFSVSVCSVLRRDILFGRANCQGRTLWLRVFVRFMSASREKIMREVRVERGEGQEEREK